MSAFELFQTLDSIGYSLMKLLVSILWQSSILLAAVGGITYALRHRNSSIRYILWVAAVLTIPLLPLISHTIEVIGTPQKEIAVLPEYSQPVESEQTETAAEQLMYTIPKGTIANTDNHENRLNLKAIEGFVSVYPWSFVVLVYGTGLCVFLCWIVIGRLRIRGWIRNGDAVIDKVVFTVFQNAAEQLGISREFLVIESDHISAPLTCRTFRPVIILPHGFASGLNERELLAVALHELGHVKRNDVAVLSLLSLVKAALFFHPLVWYAVRQVSYLAELSCDMLVIEHTRDSVVYADMLTRIAENLPARAITTELAAGFLFSKGMFLHRIKAIIEGNQQVIKRLSKLALGVTVVSAGLSLAIALALPLGEINKKNITIPVTGHLQAESEILQELSARAEEYEHLVRSGKAEFTINTVNSSVYNYFRYSSVFDGDWCFCESEGGIHRDEGEFEPVLWQKVLFAPDKFLALNIAENGSGELRKRAYVYPPDPFNEREGHPLSHGMRINGVKISRFLQGEYLKSGNPVRSIKLVRKEKVDGFDCHVVRMDFMASDDVLYAWLSDTHHLQPLKVEFSSNKRESKTVTLYEYILTDNIWCTNKVTINSYSDDTLVGKKVVEFTEFDMNTPIDNEVFSWTLPSGLKGYDYIKEKPFVTE